MGLESTNYISGLDEDNPLGTDDVNEGDNHVRMIKDVLKKQFPGAGGAGFSKPITPSEDELNYMVNARSNIQSQIDELNSTLRLMEVTVQNLHSG